MAVTTSYSFGFLESIDPFSLTGNAEAVSLANGGVAVFGDHSTHTDVTIFGSGGDITGSNSVLSGSNSAATQLSNGNLVVLGDTGTDMSFTILGATGAIVSGPTSIGENGPDVLDPEIAALTGGGFVVAVQDFFGGTDNDIDLRVYSSTGVLLINFAVDASTANDQNPSVVGLADGGFAVAWHRNIGSDNEMWYAVYNANGSVRRAPALLDTTGTVNRNASVVALDNGGFAIAYEDNGWDGDIDITLARFDAAGAFLDWDNIANNSSVDGAPSATVLSNGMIAVGTVNNEFGHNDPVWTLVDQNTGAVLTSTSTGTTHNDFSPSVAAMSLGQIATFHTNANVGDVVGQILQAQRQSIGDTAADTITGDDLLDIVQAGGGADTIRGGANVDRLYGESGNDTFMFGTNEVGIGEIIDGGTEFDRLLALDSVSFGNANLFGIEEIEFSATTSSPKTVIINAVQIGAGLANNLLVDGNLTSTTDTLRVVMGIDTSLSLAALTFDDWDSAGTENDVVLIVGDDDAETIIGSTMRDVIYGRGGNDIIRGGGENDEMRGGLDNDRYYVDDAADQVIELGGQGTDTIVSSVAETLSVNVEHLILTGVTNINGNGNTLGNQITGNGGNNTLQGKDGNDTLKGGAGVDVLVGGLGADTLTGGANADRFDFNDLAESTVGVAGRDTISRFLRAEGDRVDISKIDANGITGGNQAFNFIGTAAFTQAGQLRFEKVGGQTVVYGNTDSDGAAEFSVLIDQDITLLSTDFIL